jgi:asparagine synthase (glutamine-hydrolysing)
MCRIVGLAGFTPSQRLKTHLIAMRDAMARGGPDDAGLFIDEENAVALGNRRLSIIDLSPLGHQPMCNDDESIWITYNGELYNFPELRNELELLGYSFTSQTDTEVILKAFEEWRESAFEKFIGMFAFCIYDKRRRLLYLVRDHAGIKPLYYSFKDNALIFASETRALMTFDPSWPEHSEWRIYFLLFGHLPEPFTTLRDVYMLPKGSFLRLDLSTMTHTIQNYFFFRFSDTIGEEQAAVEGVRGIVQKAIKRHLISDVTTGVFLSGGIDSSLITLLASQYQGERLKTLSVIFDEKNYSEEKYQNIVLQKTKSQHTAYRVTERDFADNLDDIFSAMDQPTIDGINSYFISKCAKEAGFKVVLSGLGGDELFGGYPSFDRIKKVWFLRNSKMKSLSSLSEHIPDSKYNKLSFLTLKDPLNYYLFFRGLFPVRTVAEMLDAERSDIVNAIERIPVDVQKDMTPGNFASFLETNLYMQNQLLKDADCMSMWHSVEVRVPLLDKELMEFAFSVRDAIKFNSGQPKHLLIKAFQDILPKEIVTRKKQGFTFPFQLWMKNDPEKFFADAPAKYGKTISKAIKSFKNGRLHWSRFWALAVMERWNKGVSQPFLTNSIID